MPQSASNESAQTVGEIPGLVREPASVYHAKRGEYLTSHRLATFRRCPRTFRQVELGLIPEPDSAAFAFGRAAHTLILEGRDKFEAEYAVGGPINPKTGSPYGSATKAFREWEAEKGKPVISESDAATLGEMAASVRQHSSAKSLLAKGLAERVARCEIDGIKCQSRIDWVCRRPGTFEIIADLKTCDNLDSFEWQIGRFEYVYQMAFYRDVYEQATGGCVACRLIAVEKSPPYRCGVWALRPDDVDECVVDNRDAIAGLASCRANDRWPTRYEKMRIYEPTD